MYYFVYYVIYNQQIQKGKSEGFARANGGLVVALAIAAHFILLFAFTKNIIFRYLQIATVPKDWNFGYIVAFLIFSWAFKWFKSEKRTKIIMDKLLTESDPSRTGNLFKVLCVIIIPFILIFIISPAAPR